MKKLRFTPFLLPALVLLLTAAAFSACGSEAAVPADTDAAKDPSGLPETAPAETEPADPYAARLALPDNLPDMDFGGAVFRVVGDDYVDKDLHWDEQDGDVVHDAIYERNMLAAERFNIGYQFLTELTYDSNNSRINKVIQSGDDVFDLSCSHVVATSGLALKDMFLNWYDIPYVDFSQPWWAPSTREDLSYNNVCILAVGDYVLNALSKTYCMIFNKTYAADYDLPDIYALVNDGKWTLDTVISLTKDIYQDLNQDGKKDGGDFYGMGSDCYSNMNAYLWSFGSRIISREDDGSLSLTFYSEKTVDEFDKLCSMFHDYMGIQTSREVNYGLNSFREGRMVFANFVIDVGNRLRDMEDDYGIVPYPKWDEAQERYATMVDGSHAVLSVPVTNRNIEMTGILTEVLNAESYKRVKPAFYETALKEKYARDEGTIAMLDLIVDSRVFDLGYVYDNWKGASFLMQDMVWSNNRDLASTWEKRNRSISKHYDSVIAYFSDYSANH